MAGPRVLTFNFHEPYLCLMAKTGIPLIVGNYASGAHARRWHTEYRPVPGNIEFMDEPAWRDDLARGRFDAVIAHNENNAADIFEGTTPGILVCHNRRTFLETTIVSKTGTEKGQYEELLTLLQQRFRFVFISESKRDDYRVPGTVILPGIDLDDYGGYRGERAEVLRVGNVMRARNRMFDVDFQEKVCGGFPNRVVGEDPQIPAAKPSQSWDELKEKFRSSRCYLHVTRQEFEDGYNLAMLEAMATGMPVVSLANKTSPLTDGVDGVVSFDAEHLRAGIQRFMDDPAEAIRIGAFGRETVAAKFPITVFAEQWRKAIEEAAERGTYSAGTPKASETPQAPKLNVLMEYMASPFTTGRYFEAALRKKHRVVTMGLRCPEAQLAAWGFGDNPPPYPPHQLNLLPDVPYKEVMSRLPKDFTPSLFLYVDSGRVFSQKDIGTVGCPRVCYLIDTHLDASWRVALARNFHFTFLAQKAQVDLFRKAGIENVEWLPLACSPELHDLPEAERTYDVAYVGSLSDPNQRRPAMFEKIRARYPNSFIGKAWPHEMASIYARSKIVVNASVNWDVNMRVFEGLASGALVITDEAVGLEDLFVDGKHLVIYRNDEDVFGLIDKYLADDAARTRIAGAGKTAVLEKHTYQHRVDRMLQSIGGSMGGNSGESRFGKGGYYRNVRPELLRQVPEGVQRVLDVGCGGGELGRALKDRGVPTVVGIEVVERAWQMAKTVLDDALLANIERDELPFEDNYFDCIICGDVLEHLVDPTEALRKLSRILAPGGVFIISIPNVRFFTVVHMLVHGRWKYEDAGIMDRTHLRFFTKVELQEMIEAAGLDLARLEPLSMMPADRLPLGPNRTLTLGRMTISDVSEEEYEGFRVFQYLIEAAKPGADPLSRAQAAFDDKQYEKAYTLADKARNADAANRFALMGKAIAHVGRLDEAESLYLKALAAAPNRPAIRGDFGLLLIAMNRASEARGHIDAAYKEGRSAKLAGGLGLSWIAEGNHAEAFPLLKESVELQFDNEQILRHLIEAAHAEDKLLDIEEPVRRFVEFYPGNLDMVYNFASLLHKVGHTDEARDRLETLLMFSPGHEKAQTLLADILGPAASE